MSNLVARAIVGEDIIIERGDQPQVRLMPIVEPPKPRRVAGTLMGKIFLPDDFDPMTEEELALWEGK